MKYGSHNTKLSTLLLSLFAISGCNGGSSSNSTPSQPTNTTVKVGHFDFGTGNFRTKTNYSKFALTGTSNTSPIGWNSDINAPAPSSCFTYTASLTAPSGTTALGNMVSEEQFTNSLGLSASISATYGIFSASNSLNYSSMTSSNANTISIFGTAKASYVLSIEATGLNSFGQQVLTNDPNHFISICGDKVVNSLPLMVQDGVNLVFTSNNTTTSTDISDKIDAGISIVNLSAEIQSSNSSNKSTSQSNYTNYTFGDPALFTQDFDYTSLASCLNSGDSTACNTFNTSVQSAFNVAIQNAETKLNTDSTNWFSIYAIDNGKISDNDQSFILADLSSILTSDQLQQIKNQQDNQILAPYTDIIKYNLELLEDLDAIKAKFNDVNGLNNTQLSVSTSLNFSNVMTDYANAIGLAFSSQNTLLGNCIGADTTSDATKYCGQLSKTTTVFDLLKKSFKAAQSSDAQAELDGLNATVKSMIYNVSLSNSYEALATGPGGTFTPIGTIPQRLVFLPNDDASKTFTVLTLNGSTAQSLLPANTFARGVALNYKVTDETKIPLDLFKKDDFIIPPYSEYINDLYFYTSSMAVNFNSSNQGLAENHNTSTINPLIVTNPGHDLSTCDFYGTQSAGCIWTLNFGTLIKTIVTGFATVKKATVNITSNYSEIPKPFNTLYPYQ